MTYMLRCYPSAALPAHNATSADIEGGAGDAHEMSTFSNVNNSPENGQTNSSSLIQTVSINSEPWMRFTHPTGFARNEIANSNTTPGITPGTVAWHSVSFIVRQGTLPTGGGAALANLTQVHQTGGLPPWTLYFDRPSTSSYRFRFKVDPGGTNVNISTFTSFPFDERFDVLWKTDYRQTSAGTCALYWRRSSDLTDFSGSWTGPVANNGQNMRSDNTSLYFKQGCYRPSADSSTWIVDHKGYLVAQTDGSTTDAEAREEAEALYGTNTSPPDPDPPPDTLRIGVSAAGGSYAGASADRGRFSTFTADLDSSTQYQLTGVAAYLDGAGGGAGSQDFRFAVYDGSNALIGQTADSSIAAGASGAWVALDLEEPYIFSDGSIFSFALHTGTTANVIRYAYDVEVDALFFYDDTFSDGPTESFSGGNDAKRMSIYGIYEEYDEGEDPPPPPPSTGSGYIVGGRVYIAGRRAANGIGARV
jgi:hypothetical protein